jgi:Zn-dependent M28 family amino/carboxypeptidase
MLSLETLGYFSERQNSQEFPISLLRAWYPNEGNFITVVSNLQGMSVVRTVKKAMRAASPLPVYSINAPSQVEGIDYSDHFNYWRNGYPAVMITDTAFNRNKAYHTAADAAERLDYMRMAMVVQGLHSAVLAAAR